MTTTSGSGAGVNALLSSSYAQRRHVTDAYLRPSFSFRPSSSPTPLLPLTQPLHNTIRVPQKRNGVWRRQVASDSAAEAAVEALEGSEAGEAEPARKEKMGVVVKAVEKPRLVLKFIWMEKNIGLALDQVIPGHGTIPLSPYYFWPRKDAWEEMKTLLESKPWISQKSMIILLNQATDIINLWQQSGGGL